MPNSDFSILLGNELKARIRAFQLLSVTQQAVLLKLLNDELIRDVIFTSLDQEARKVFIQKLFDKLIYNTITPENLTAEFVTSKIRLINTPTTPPSPMLEIGQWLLMFISAGVAIATLTVAIAFPPAVIPLLGVTLVLAALKLPLGVRGLAMKPSFSRAVNLIGLLGAIAMISAAIAFPPLIPVIGIASAIFTIAIESFKAVKDISSFITTAQKLSKEERAAEKTELTVKSIELGFKLGLAATVIGLAVGAFFCPPLGFAAVATAIVGGVGFAAYKKWGKPSLMKALIPAKEIIDEKTPLLNSRRQSESETLKRALQVASVPQHIINDTSSHKANVRSRPRPMIYKREDGTPSSHSLDKVKIQSEARTLFGNEIKKIDVGPGRVLIRLHSSNIISVRAHSIHTLSPDAPGMIENSAKLAKAIGWKKVRISEKLADNEKISAKSCAQQANLEVIEDAPPVFAEDRAFTPHH